MTVKSVNGSGGRHYVADSLVGRSGPVKVLLAGAGGSGSQMVTGLARMHCALTALGHPGIELSVIDGDAVSPANVGRQLFSAADVGRNKAECIVTRVNMFFGLSFAAYPFMLDKNHMKDMRSKVGIIITAVDRAETRLMVHEAVLGSPVYHLDLGNGKTSGQAVLGTGDFITQPKQGVGHLPTVVDLYPSLRENERDAKFQGPSCSLEAALRSQDFMVNQAVATLALELLWKCFRTGSLTHHGFFLNLETMKVNPLAVDPEAWKKMGWNPMHRTKKKAA